MKIEEGKLYRRRDGWVVGPMSKSGAVRDCFTSPCRGVWTEFGEWSCNEDHAFDLVAEAPEPPCGGKTGDQLSPVRTVTRKEIVPGTYGPGARLNIEARDGDQSETYIDLIDGWYKAPDIREFARLLNEIADAMEDQP